MSRITFVMLHPGFIRYYDDALRAMADAGHDVHLAFEISREKLGEHQLPRRLSAYSSRVTCGTTPARTESVREFIVRGDRWATRSGGMQRRVSSAEGRLETWDSLATTVRLLRDYLRFFAPEFAGAPALRARAEKRLPRIYRRMGVAAAAGSSGARSLLDRLLRVMEDAIPANPDIERFLEEQQPDLLLVTPLIELGSQQVDYVKAAARLGIRSALAVASWDNLTSKGLIRVIPDHVLVWNDVQKQEAIRLHQVPDPRVVVTGAQVFDKWFASRPSRSRETFAADVGIDPARPFVVYVGSSSFIAPDEVPFAERWLARLRAHPNRTLASVGVVFRPHPANARQWRAFDVNAWHNVAVWPPVGSDPNDAGFHQDFFDSLFHSAAVVGVNTSAQVEAAIVGRPVFTVQAREFAHSQAGTLHFKHLVDADHGFVRSAATIDEHLRQLDAALGVDPAPGEANRRFVRGFIRPQGEHIPSVDTFVAAVDSLVRLGSPVPRPEPLWSRVLRPCTYVVACVARELSDDRPLWAYLLRPVVTVAVRVAAIPYTVRGLSREYAYLPLKRFRRAVHGVAYETTRAVQKQWKKAQGRARRVLAAASSAHRRG